MVFVNDGLKNVRKWLAQTGGDPPTVMALGTSGTTATEDDVALGAEISSTREEWDNLVEGDFTIDYEYALASTDGNGLTLREFGLIDSVSDSLYTRDTFTALNKDASKELQVNLTVKLINEE
jgi:hypothetical protein